MEELKKKAEEFLEDIKLVLDVTWNEDVTNKKIVNIIIDGMNYLENDVDSTINFKEDFLAIKLLRTYCRYAWNNAEEYFIENNIQDILKLEVEYAKKSKS